MTNQHYFCARMFGGKHDGKILTLHRSVLDKPVVEIEGETFRYGDPEFDPEIDRMVKSGNCGETDFYKFIKTS